MYFWNSKTRLFTFSFTFVWDTFVTQMSFVLLLYNIELQIEYTIHLMVVTTAAHEHPSSNPVVSEVGKRCVSTLKVRNRCGGSKKGSTTIKLSCKYAPVVTSNV